MERRNLVLESMVETHSITRAEADKAKATPLKLAPDYENWLVQAMSHGDYDSFWKDSGDDVVAHEVGRAAVPVPGHPHHQVGLVAPVQQEPVRGLLVGDPADRGPVGAVRGELTEVVTRVERRDRLLVAPAELLERQVDRDFESAHLVGDNTSPIGHRSPPRM